MECLIRCQAAVLAVIWRSPDALGTKQAAQQTEVTVFASSGFAKRYNLYKISLHFIWENVYVDAHQSKTIRNATLAFLATKKCGPLHRLLSKAHNGADPTVGGTVNPWEDVLDKASAEGSSLRMPYTDKALRLDKKAGNVRAGGTFIWARFFCEYPFPMEAFWRLAEKKVVRAIVRMDFFRLTLRDSSEVSRFVS